MGTGRGFLSIALLSFFTMAVFSCGMETEHTTVEGTPKKTISGIAQKGRISGAYVELRAINSDGTPGDVLGSTTTGADGSYNIIFINHSGTFLVTVTGGSYLDEGTGIYVSNPDTFRAAVVNVTENNSTINVTPYTEVAVRHAGSFAASNITSANNKLSNLLGGINIITTMPSDVTDASSNLDPIESIEYGLAAAAISQSVANGSFADTEAVMEAVAKDLDDSILQGTAAAMAQAVAECASGDLATIELVVDLVDIQVDDAIAIAEVEAIPDIYLYPDEEVVPPAPDEEPLPEEGDPMPPSQ